MTLQYTLVFYTEEWVIDFINCVCVERDKISSLHSSKMKRHLWMWKPGKNCNTNFCFGRMSTWFCKILKDVMWFKNSIIQLENDNIEFYIGRMSHWFAWF